MANRDFKGVWIPREVWLDTRLNALEKIILTEVDSLDCGDEGCFAGNKYIADFCQCSERKVTEAISKLISLGYISVGSFDGRQRILRSCLAKTARQASKNCEADSQKVRGCTIENNISNNTSIKKAAMPHFVPPTVEEVAEYCRERNNGIDAEAFVAFYGAKGWMIGKNKMKDWKKAIITWEKRQKALQPEQPIQVEDEYDVSKYLGGN